MKQASYFSLVYSYICNTNMAITLQLTLRFMSLFVIIAMALSLIMI